jgi:hypothetical protein
MDIAVEGPPSSSAADASSMGCVYVLEIGAAGDLYKIGKAKDYAARLKAHRTMSTERLTLYAEIETEQYTDVETYLKHLLQGHRWLEGEGRELYKAERHVIDEAIDAARRWATVVLPRMEQANALTEQESDGTTMTPDAAVMELYRERLRLKQFEWAAKHEGERIDAELKVMMGTADELTGVAVYRSGLTSDFDERSFRADDPERYDRYVITRPTRAFKIRW